MDSPPECAYQAEPPLPEDVASPAECADQAETPLPEDVDSPAECADQAEPTLPEDVDSPVECADQAACSDRIVALKNILKEVHSSTESNSRMQEDGSEMVMCDGCQLWFHCNCVRYAGVDKWNCEKCKKM